MIMLIKMFYYIYFKVIFWNREKLKIVWMFNKCELFKYILVNLDNGIVWSYKMILDK